MEDALPEKGRDRPAAAALTLGDVVTFLRAEKVDQNLVRFGDG